MTASADLAALATHVWERTLELNPTLATVYGDERFDDRLDDPGPVGRAARRELAEEAIARATAIDPTSLVDEERITRDLIREVATAEIEADDARMDLLGAVQQQGHQSLLPELVQFQKADTPERLDRLIARLEAYPALADAFIELLREGEAQGLTAARAVAERTIGQLERLVAVNPEESPIVTIPAVADDAARARIAEAVRRHVLPSDARYLEALRRHLPATREVPGLCSAPDGAARYRTRIRAFTSLDMPAEELHQIGLEELTSIESERQAIARAAGFGNDTAAYRAALNADPVEIPESREALVARCQDDVDRAFAVADRWFLRVPRAACEVRPVEPLLEKDAPGAYYYMPAVDGSRPGIYFVNTYDLPSRAYWTAASTTYHEAVPGHHFQLALEMEMDGLPEFRKLGIWPQGNAYVEGWALYTERLADEAGLFRNEAERFGMLDSQALRAVRLVVDTGLHAFGWTRQRAYETIVAAGIHPTDADSETDRYIAWPGQALGYMMGRREIQRLRDERRAREGSSFDIRRFHDDVLRHGKLPLSILAGVVLDGVAGSVAG
jgi:uncharacterized protein (DUF885 family)